MPVPCFQALIPYGLLKPRNRRPGEWSLFLLSDDLRETEREGEGEGGKGKGQLNLNQSAWGL